MSLVTQATVHGGMVATEEEFCLFSSNLEPSNEQPSSCSPPIYRNDGNIIFIAIMNIMSVHTFTDSLAPGTPVDFQEHTNLRLSMLHPRVLE